MPAAWHAAMDAKYFTYIHAMDAVLPEHGGRGAGNVVNIIGMGGKVATSIHLPGGAANSALMLATVGLAQVHGPHGIRINAINPGATLTDRVKEALKLEASVRKTSEEEVLAQGQARVPLRRYASPEEIANVALFLASDRASVRDRCAHSDGRRIEPGDLRSREHPLSRSARFPRSARKTRRAQTHYGRGFAAPRDD